MEWVQYWRMCDTFYLEDIVRASWRACGMPRRVLVGLSGGADSVCLLSLLVRLRADQAGFECFALHIHHGLRAQADADAAFCEALCKQLDVPYFMERVHVPDGASLENQARAVRRAALLRVADTLGAEVIALAHHADDQAETLLMHLARGSGLRGLCGMRERSENIWRPLLGIRGRQLRVYLKGMGQSFCTDETNASPEFLRNAVRLTALPALEECLPGFVLSASRAARLLQQDEDCLTALSETLLAQGVNLTPPHRFVLLSALQGCPPALQSRTLRAAFMKASGRSGDLDMPSTERMMSCLCGANGCTVNLPGGWRARRSHTRLHLLPPPEHIDPPFDGTWKLEPNEPDGRTGDGLRSQLLSEDTWRACTLRTRRPGDTITPFGASGSQPLKQYLIDRHVDEPFRDDWPLLARGSRIVWVIGVGASEDAAVRNPGMPCLYLTFSGRLPGDMMSITNKEIL